MGKEMDNLPRTALLTGVDKRYSFHQKLRELVGDSDAEGSSSLSSPYAPLPFLFVPMQLAHQELSLPVRGASDWVSKSHQP